MERWCLRNMSVSISARRAILAALEKGVSRRRMRWLCWTVAAFTYKRLRPPVAQIVTITATTADGQDPSLFRRLVLGWIEADFRVQIRIFQHFSKSTRKSSSREQILQISARKLQNFTKILTFFGKFCKILQNFQKSAKFWQKFAEFLQNFTEICRF